MNISQSAFLSFVLKEMHRYSPMTPMYAIQRYKKITILNIYKYQKLHFNQRWTMQNRLLCIK